MRTVSDSVAHKHKSSYEFLRGLFYAVALALLVRVFLFAPFNIPSGSMIPTLLVGDYVFVSKYAYGYSEYNLAFGWPLFEGRVLFESPKRGDVVVFKLPSDNSTDYIKRLIGLPGDRIQLRRGVLYLNGSEVRRELVPEPVPDPAFDWFPGGQIYRETLPSGVSYLIQERGSHQTYDNTQVYEVPQGHYFMMGDNRDNSLDSRASVGYVPEKNLVGRAEITFLSLRPGAPWWQIWHLPGRIRFGRLFQLVR